VGSNSALAVALYARKLGFDSTCFLMHQAKTPFIPATLNLHIRNGTEIVRYGGAYASRIGTLREHLWNRDAWVIPMGCSLWRGNAGFIAADLELAEQVAAGVIPQPDRIYVGTGTMGTAAGLGLGLAIAGLDTQVHAARVSHTSITNERLLCRLTEKTVTMLRRLDDTLLADTADRVNIRLRDEFFGDGYGHGTAAADEAIAYAAEQPGLPLEPTYAGKTMAALLADLRAPGGDTLNLLYWNTCCALPATVPYDRPLDTDALPAEFLRYFE
jgi:D-cysteine desulfhydrase